MPSDLISILFPAKCSPGWTVPGLYNVAIPASSERANDCMELRGPRTIRFGTFEADAASGQLRRAGHLIKLQEQPFRVLMLLLRHPGEVVTRDELREKLWGDTHVEFEDGLNTAIRKLRDALGDSAANPRFIETLPRRGYRFIAPVHAEQEREPTQTQVVEHKPPAQSMRYVWVGLAALFIALVAVAYWWLRPIEVRFDPSPPVQLTRDSGLTTDPAISRDGKLLAYASDRGGADNLDIWIQHTSGGEPRRLAAHPADDHQPDISPDGSEVVFRSEREDGGVYAVPALIGTPKLLVSEAYVPRYSPDGSRIAYAIGSVGSGGFWGSLFVYSRSAGSPQRVAPEVLTSGPAAWSPDGEWIAFAGAKHWTETPSLWIASTRGGGTRQLSAIPISSRSSFTGHVRTISVAWVREQIIVSAQEGDSWNLWGASISAQTQQLTTPLARITLGSGNEVLPSVSAAGRVVFAQHNYATDIWAATVKNGRAGTMHRLTNDSAVDYRPSVSADGGRLAYVSDRARTFDVWLRDLASGNETQVTSSSKPVFYAAISRDGGQIAFGDGNDISIIPAAGGSPRRLCENCGRPDDWSPEGRLVGRSGTTGAWAGIAAWEPNTAAITLLIGPFGAPTGRPPPFDRPLAVAPHLSPDGKWITFHTTDHLNRQVHVAPYTGAAIPPSSWIAVTDNTALDREARWAADGNSVYFLSDRDGFRCIWSRKLNPRTKQPVDPIFPVLHLHDPRLSLMHVPDTGHVSLCSVGDKLIFAMGELTGNLWSTEVRQSAR